MTLTFRNDQPDIAIDVLREVGQWLVDNNMTLWEIPTLTTGNLLDEHTIGNLYVVYATITVDLNPLRYLFCNGRTRSFGPTFQTTHLDLSTN